VIFVILYIVHGWFIYKVDAFIYDFMRTHVFLAINFFMRCCHACHLTRREEKDFQLTQSEVAILGAIQTRRQSIEEVDTLCCRLVYANTEYDTLHPCMAQIQGKVQVNS